MSVGFPSLKGDFDSRAGSLITALRDGLYNCSRFCAILQSAQWPDATLVALGYTQAEVTLMKNAFQDVGGTGNSLYNIAHAAGTVTANNDFFANAKLLTGVI
jgi:hypothetical protein